MEVRDAAAAAADVAFVGAASVVATSAVAVAGMAVPGVRADAAGAAAGKVAGGGRWRGVCVCVALVTVVPRRKMSLRTNFFDGPDEGAVVSRRAQARTLKSLCCPLRCS